MNTASTQTFCMACNHPMHWRMCAVLTPFEGASCQCRNDTAILAASADVWDRLERQPGFNERVRRGTAQLDAGERVRFTAMTPDTGPGRVMLWIIGSWIVALAAVVAVLWRALS